MSIHHDPRAPPVTPSQAPEDEGVVGRAVTWVTTGVTKAAIRFVDPGEPRAQEVSEKLAALASGDNACGDILDLALRRLIEWGQTEASGEPTPLTPIAKKIALYTSDEGTRAGVTQFLKVFLGELILHLGKEMVEEGKTFENGAALMNAATGRILETVFSQLEDLKEGTEEEKANQIVDDLFSMAFEKGSVNWLVAFAGRHRLKPVLKEALKEALTDYFSNFREVQELSKKFQAEPHFHEFDPTFETIDHEIQAEIDRALFYLPGQLEVLLGEDRNHERVDFLNQFVTLFVHDQYLARQPLIHDLASVALGSLFDPSKPIHGEGHKFAKEYLPLVLSELVASKEGVAEFLDQLVVTNESNEYQFQQLLVRNVLEQRKKKLMEKGEEDNRTAITLVNQQIRSLEEKVPQDKLVALLTPVEGVDEVDWSGRLISVLNETDFRERRRLLRELGMNVIMAPAAERLLTKVLEEKLQGQMSDGLYAKASKAILGLGLPFVARHLSNFSFDMNIATNQYLLEAEVARMDLITMGAQDIIINPLEEVMNLLFGKVEGLQFGNPLIDGIMDALVRDQAAGNLGPLLTDIGTIFVARTLEKTEGKTFGEKVETISAAISDEIEDTAHKIDLMQAQPPDIKKAWFEEQRKTDYPFYIYSKHLSLDGEKLYDAMIEFSAARELSEEILNTFTTKEDLEEILPLSFADFPIHDLIVNQMTWQLAPYIRDIYEMVDAGMSFTAQVERAREYLVALEGEESRILKSLEALIQQASSKYFVGESTAARLVKALANENLLEKPALDMATVCVAHAIQFGEGDSPSDKMASLLKKIEVPVIRAIDESKERDDREVSREMSEGITRIFIDPETLSDRDRPIFDLIVDQLTHHIEPYFVEIQKYRDVRDLLFQLTDEETLAEAKQIIGEVGGADLKQFMHTMLGEGLSLSKQQLVTGDEVVDDLIAAAFETDWKGVSAEQLVENASTILAAQALRRAEGETLEEKMASISRHLSFVIDQSFKEKQPEAVKIMAEGIFSIFLSPEEQERPLYQYLLEQVVDNLSPSATFLFDYYDLLRQQKPLPGEPAHLEQILLDLALLGIDESVLTQGAHQTFETVAVKGLISELKEKGEESAIIEAFRGGIRRVGKGAPDFFKDSKFLRDGIVKIVAATSRELTEEEKDLFGDMDRFSEALTDRLFGIMFDPEEAPSDSFREAICSQLKEQLSLLDAENELKRNQLIRDQLKIFLQKSKGSKKEKVVPRLKRMTSKIQVDENEKVKGEIASLASELILDQVEKALAERVPLAGFLAFVFSPLLSFLRTLLFFRLQWLMLKILDSTSGEEGQIMMCRMIWEAVGLFDPQEKVPEMQQRRLGKLRAFLSELKNRPFEMTSPFLSSSYLIKDDDSISQILQRFHDNLHAQRTST